MARRGDGWSLFADWCQARGVVTVGPDDVSRFFEQVPCSPTTAMARVRSIRTHLGLTPPARPRWVRIDDLLPLPKALRYVPAYGAGALTGRRDELVLVAREVGVSASRVRTLAGRDAKLWSVSGHTLEFSRDTITCHRCVLARWLDVLDVLPPLGFRADVQALLFRAPTKTHRCASPVAGRWRSAPVLLPSIDRYGWPGGVGLSPRSVVGITARRLDPSAADGPAADRLPGLGRRRRRDVAQAKEEISDLLDELTRRIDELDAMAGSILTCGK